MKKIKTASIEIPDLLKKEIEYYIKKNKQFSSFEDFLDFHLKHGLQGEILACLSQLERSYRCKDLNPKTVRRIYSTLGEKQEYFLCDRCKEDSVFVRYEFEEKIQWGDWNHSSA